MQKKSKVVIMVWLLLVVGLLYAGFKYERHKTARTVHTDKTSVSTKEKNDTEIITDDGLSALAKNVKKGLIKGTIRCNPSDYLDHIFVLSDSDPSINIGFEKFGNEDIILVINGVWFTVNKKECKNTFVAWSDVGNYAKNITAGTVRKKEAEKKQSILKESKKINRLLSDKSDDR